MSGPESDEQRTLDPAGKRPVADELICLKQSVNILKLVEELGECGNFEDDTLEIVDVLKVARRMIEEVIAALTAHLAAQGGAT